MGYQDELVGLIQMAEQETRKDNQGRDRLFAVPREWLPDFSFDQDVAEVFPDMIRRSVPGYGTVITLTGLLAARYVTPGSQVYDLGCSLGATLISVGRQLVGVDCRLVGIDNAGAMLDRCHRHVEAAGLAPLVELRQEDVRHAAIDKASVVILNFTLQFIPPADRLALLRRIHAGLRPGGLLILSEKLAFDDAMAGQRMEALHMDFKRANGYSELEISQKRTALENVLVPETLQRHRERLAEAGFTGMQTWFQCFNFASLMAFKTA